MQTHHVSTVRFIFASCAAATNSPLSATQRAAIIMALHDPQWVPTAADIPDTWAVVEAWHAGVDRKTSHCARERGKFSRSQ